MTSSESESQPRPRKRSRTSTTGDETGGKKARGRPRVDTQDATAADRRRTQIRLAQRAYRQRKETTISSLKEQNDRLQAIIEQMNTSFLHFNDSIVKSGLLHMNSNLHLDLKHAREKFVALTKSAGEGNHDGEDEQEQEQEQDQEQEHDAAEGIIDQASEFHRAATASRETQQPQPSQARPPPVGQHVEVGWGYSTSLIPTSSSRNTTPPPRHVDLPIYGNYLPSIPGVTYPGSAGPRLPRATTRFQTMGELLDQRSQNIDYTGPLPFGLLELSTQSQAPHFQPPSHTYTVNIPTPDVTPPTTRLSTPPMLPSINTKTLKPVWTYSHEETTFARRLTRAALETGFHVLSSATTRPAALNYIFRLSLPYMGLDALRERFKMLLARGTDEELDFWETPFIHIGGAGTHYPRKDSQGNVIPLPNAWNVRSIGPIHKRFVRAENSQDPSQTHTLAVDLSGFEGSDWFDSRDVEGYLEEIKGCVINPRDMFAEVQIDDDDDDDTGRAKFRAPFSKDIDMTLDVSSARPTSPGLSYGSSSAESASASAHSTPTHTLDAFGQETFGLDMGMANLNDTFKLPDFDVSGFLDQPLGLDLAAGFDANPFSTNSFGGGASNHAFDLMGEATEPLPLIKQKKKKTAWVDVSKLVDELVRHGVCLGRAPGFRKVDVEAAFRAALVQAL